MNERKHFLGDDFEEILPETENSSLDAWIQPEMLRRCTSKHKTTNGELNEEQ